MKVVMVAHSSNVAGTEVAFDRALAHLVGRRTYDIRAAYPDGEFAQAWQGLAPRIKYEGSLPPTMRPLGYLGAALRSVYSVGELRRELAENPPDVVVVFTSVATAAVAEAKRAGVPCVCYVREFISPAAVQRAVWSFLAARCERLIVISAALAQALEPYAPGRVALVPDGVPVPDLEGWSWPPPVPTVSCYAGYNKAKGAETFVLAAQEASERIPSARFRLYGVASASQGAERSRLQKMVVAHGVSECFSFVERTDFSATYRDASLVVVPSAREGLGLVALEAMAAGVPVVASRTGGLIDVIGESEAGTLVRVGDSDAFASAVVGWLRDADRLTRGGAAARSRVQERFSLGKSMLGLEAVLAEVLDPESPQS